MARDSKKFDEERFLEEERLIASATELICRLMEDEGITRSDLARRIGVTRGWITQMLDGSRNLTLRTLADVLCALGHKASITAAPSRETAESTNVTIIEFGAFGRHGERSKSWPSDGRLHRSWDQYLSYFQTLETGNVADFKKRFASGVAKPAPPYGHSTGSQSLTRPDLVSMVDAYFASYIEEESATSEIEEALAF